VYIGLTIFLGVAGVNTNNNLVCLVVAMLLGIMGASGFFGKRNLSAITISFVFPREIYVNRHFSLAVHLKNNRSRLPVFLMHVVVGEKSVLFPFVNEGAEAVAYLPFSFANRGNQGIGDVYLKSAFPFSFFIRATKVKASFETIVFPEPLEFDIVPPQNEAWQKKGGYSSSGLGDSHELAAIREYTPGDPLKYINWKATAKTGKPKTKLFSAMSHQPVIIDFDKIEIRGLEEKISCITFIILNFLRKGIPVGVRFPHRVFTPSLSEPHKFAILRELALYDHG
jgi:uncharacterized protein (DUF58 family)